MNIPKMNTVALPRLAQGGYVKANSPQLAMIGDNRHEGEIVTPENKMYEIMMAVLESFFNKLQDKFISSNNDNTPQEIHLHFDGDLAAFAQIFKPYLDDENSRRGVKLVIGGTK